MSYSLYTSDPFTYPGGSVAAGVLVAVYYANTSISAPIYHDDLGITPKANPVRTDGTGVISFWIEPGTYALWANGVRTPITVDAIPDPPGPEDYVTRSDVEEMIAAAGGGLLPPVVAKGDLYAAQAAGSVGLLSVGTNGQVLSADSTTATGLRWADAASGGGGAVTSVFGRAGVVTAQAGDYTKAQVGLGNVDNTSDVGKPVSTAQQAALDLKETITAHNADVATLNASIAAKADAAATTTALAGKQPLDSDLTTIAGLTPSNSDTLQYIAGAWANRTAAQVKATLAIAESDVTNLVTDLAAKQPLDSDLTTIAGLTATTDNFLQAKASAWASRTPTQVATDLQGLVTIAESQVTNLVADLAAKQPLDADLTTIAGLTATTDNIIQSVGSAWASRTPAQVKAALAIAQSDVSGLTAALALLAPLASPTLTGTVTMSGRLVITPDALTVNTGAVATDASLGNHFDVAATANFTLNNPTNPSHGQRALWAITQDATGSRIMTLGSAFIFGTDITSATLSTAANKTDLLGAVYDSTSAKWRICMFIKGF